MFPSACERQAYALCFTPLAEGRACQRPGRILLPSSMEGQSGRLGRRSDSRWTTQRQSTPDRLSARSSRLSKGE